MWQSLKGRLAHAFTVPSRRGLEEGEMAFLDAVAQKVFRRRLVAPALFILEALRPVHYTGSQLLVFLGPVFKVAVDARSYDTLVSLLERPAAIDYLASAIERIAAVPDV